MNRPRSLRHVPWWLRYHAGARAASRARQLLVQATHGHCSVRFLGPVHLGPGFSLNIPDAGTLVVGPGVEFRRGFHCEISGEGRVVIGAGSVFTSYSLIQCTTSIEIGEGCLFGQSILLADGFHKFRDPSRPFLEQGYDFRPVRIEDGAVILTKCTVTADVGRRAVVGASSVVTRPIPAYCLAGGAPARVIEYFGPDEDRPKVEHARPG